MALVKPNQELAPTHRLVAEDVRVHLLCNNAASGSWGPFEKTPAPSLPGMIKVNVGAVEDLCHHFFPDLTSFPTSAIINVSSPAAFQPVPYMAVYAATKSFLYSFSQALNGESKDAALFPPRMVIRTVKRMFPATEYQRVT